MGKVKEQLLNQFDVNFEKETDDYLINTAFDPRALADLDRSDMLNLVEELARRYQRLLDINAYLDGES